MSKFSAYGMVGVGIAAAIGFVFALSFFSRAPADDGQLLQSSLPAGEQDTARQQAQDSSQPSMFAKNASGGEAAPAPGAESAMMQAGAKPSVASVVALGADRQPIGEVQAGTKFELGKTVIIQATFNNPNEQALSGQFAAIRVQGPGSSQAAFQGEIAASSSVTLELAWTPQQAGDYSIVLSAGPDTELASRASEPLSEIPVTVE